eukprot:g2463.t1
MDGLSEMPWKVIAAIVVMSTARAAPEAQTGFDTARAAPEAQTGFDTARAAPEAQTGFGSLRGTFTANWDGSAAAEAFLGVPYALPPTGERRFAPPADWAAPFAGGARNCTDFGPICPQSYAAGTSEDCLTLNVWRPAGTKAGDKLPVLFFIHGGAFVGGSSGGGGHYWGASLATANRALVVSANYRLGFLGFAAFGAGPGPSAGAAAGAPPSPPGPLSGNFGLADQRSALRWVQAQLGTLGGDPARVLLFGESAGAMSVMLHAVSPASAGLFARVLAESGSVADVWPATFALNRSAAFGARLGCNATAAAPADPADPAFIACLRRAPAPAVLRAQAAEAADQQDAFANVGWSPAVDGQADSLPRHPLRLFRDGAIVRGVDAFAAGTNSDEGSMFSLPYFPNGLPPSQWAGYVRAVATFGGRHPMNETALASARALYPCAAPAQADCAAAAARLVTDNAFVCGTRHAVRGAATAAAAQGRRKLTAWLYHWAYRSASDHGNRSSYPDDFGVYHSIELPFVFNVNPNPGPHGAGSTEGWSLSKAERALAARVGGMWGALAATGVPHPGGGSAAAAPAWPEYDAAGDANLLVSAGGGFGVESGRRKRYCDFWDSVRDV